MAWQDIEHVGDVSRERGGLVRGSEFIALKAQR